MNGARAADGKVERIVVALDAVTESRAAIGAAARLAARWKARLHGIFVEDDDLLRLAGLPFARQVTLGAGIEALTLQQVQRQLHALAERARRDVAAAARRHGVEWSFETTRELGPGAIGAAGDFLVAGTATRPVGPHFRAQCRMWSIASGTATCLLAQADGDPHGAIAVLLHERSAASERLLAAAVRLAEANEARLAIICDPKLAGTPGFRTWLDERLSGHGVAVELDLLQPAAALHRRIVELHCRFVAVTAAANEAQPERLRALVADIACDVLVVR